MVDSHNAMLCLTKHFVIYWLVRGARAGPPPPEKEAIVQTSVQPLTPRDASCADTSRASGALDGGDVGPAAVVAPMRAQLFPPRDADAETRRRWLASSPWPEVVFASAGAT